MKDKLTKKESLSAEDYLRKSLMIMSKQLEEILKGESKNTGKSLRHRIDIPRPISKRMNYLRTLISIQTKIEERLTPYN